MNYCDKMHYTFCSVHKLTDFSLMVDKLLASIPQNEQVLRLTLFGMSDASNESFIWGSHFQAKVRFLLGSHMPAISYVAQPVLNASLTMEVQSYLPDVGDCLTFRSHASFPYVVLENSSGRFLFAGGFQGNLTHESIEQKSNDAFQLLGEVLKKESFPINSIIRQWNYIEQITSFNGENQHYQSLNNARTEFYAHADWTSGYPAATGIGMNLGGVTIDVDAAVFRSADAFATPIDNPWQVAAHVYSEKVLKESQQAKTTPKFERAKSITFGNRRVVYISGTAAIRGEESLKEVGLERQLQITMENIALLIGNAQLILLRVYLKNKSDYETAKVLMESYGLNLPIAYLCADICREELLIEIEGIAKE